MKQPWKVVCVIALSVVAVLIGLSVIASDEDGMGGESSPGFEVYQGDGEAPEDGPGRDEVNAFDKGIDDFTDDPSQGIPDEEKRAVEEVIPDAPEATEGAVQEADKAQARDTPDGSEPSEEHPTQEELNTLSREAVQKGMEAIRPFVEECYRNIVEDFPEATGRVQMNFTIEADGEHGRVSVSEIDEASSLHETSLHECLTDNIFNIEFDTPYDDGIIDVTYPFNFSTDTPEDR